jgi:ATP-dependent Clp protease ATP-binding subunit ClpB
MTSNLGGEYVREMAGLGFKLEDKKDKEIEDRKEDLKEKIMESLREFFRPEFLNRIDEIIIFNPLSMEDLKKIIDIQVERINQRLKEKNLAISLTESAKRYFAEKGYSSEYGARPLKRLMEKEILDVLADKIINQEIEEDSKIVINYQKGGLVFKPLKGVLV